MISINENNELRGKTQHVYDTIKILSENKNKNTILGVAIVLNKENTNNLYEIVSELKKKGVEYISLNPYHSQTNTIAEFYMVDVKVLKENIKRIKHDIDILLPSESYLEFIYSHYSAQEIETFICPSTTEFCFISPWGQVFPCSNECWHDMKGNETVTIKESLGECLKDLQKTMDCKKITTKSNCFSTRCMGLWKLFYDDVFTLRN